MHLFSWRWTFAIACLVWLGGTAAGYSAMASVDGSPFAAEAADATEEVPGEEEPSGEAEMESWALFTFILGRNAMVYCWLLTGLLCGGVSTFLVLAGNGLMLGQAMGAATASGMPGSALADLLLTHGVLEIGTFVSLVPSASKAFGCLCTGARAAGRRCGRCGLAGCSPSAPWR